MEENKGAAEEWGKRAGEDEKAKNSPRLDAKGSLEHGLFFHLGPVV